MRIQLALVLSAMFTTPTLADIAVSDPWARATVLASRPAAAYLTVESSTDDRLIDFNSPAASKVMIHAVKTGSDGVGRMNHLEGLDLPAGRAVTLEPGKMHLMLMELDDKLEEGTRFPLTLVFEKAGEVTIEVPVLGVGAAGPADAEQ